MIGRSGSAHTVWPRQLAPAEAATDPMAPSGTGTTQPHSHTATGTATAASGRRGGMAGRLLPFLVLAVWTLGLTGAHAREQPQLQLHHQQQQQQQQQQPRPQLHQQRTRRPGRTLVEAESTGKAVGRVVEFVKELKAMEKASSASGTVQEASSLPAKASPDSSLETSSSPQTGASKPEEVVKELFVLEDTTPQEWEQRTLRKHGLFSFVSFSAYRLSPYRITVVAFGATVMRSTRKLQGCAWVRGNGSVVKGRPFIRLLPTDFHKEYEMMLVDCWLPPGPGEEAAMARTEGMLESSEPGYLRLQIDNEVSFPYREDNGYKIHPWKSKGPFQHSLCFCGAPMFGTMEPQAVTQFIDYHRYHAGMDHFIFYDSGSVTGLLRQQLEALASQGLVTVTPFIDILQYETMNQGQYVFFHDCLYRTRETARWIAFHDLDEYIEVPPPWTLPAILKQHEGEPFLTHGAYGYNVDVCEGDAAWGPPGGGGKYAVEMMLMRAKIPHCWSQRYKDPELCLGVDGHRKYFVNPRLMFLTHTHSPTSFIGKGTNMRVSQLRHAHFRGLFIQSRACKGRAAPTHSTLKKAIELDNPLYNITEGDRVTSVAEIAAGARACAAQGFADKDKCFPKRIR